MRNPERAEAEAVHFEPLIAVGENAPSLEEKLELARVLRRARALPLDEFLIRHVDTVGRAVLEAREVQRKLKQLVDSLLEPPWHPALFLRALAGGPTWRALVMSRGTLLAVGRVDGLEVADLRIGDEVLLAKDGNVIVGRAQAFLPRCGETAFFERATADGRLVVKWRDEEIVVDGAAGLAEAGLKPGDQVRWDRTAWLALERIERADGARFLLDEVPHIDRGHVGGRHAALDTLLDALTATLTAPELAARYQLGARQSILMHGPPGCGKTLMARVAAAAVQRVSGRRCRFAVVKPAEWERPYVGETQAQIRQVFAVLREAAREAYAILFLDEIEAVGRIRGAATNVHADKFLAALLAELDGFTDRAGVAIIAATNRKDLVDPALLERLSDVEIAVGRPNMHEARAIFSVHLGSELPYSPNGTAAAASRDAIIDAAVSRLYSPNAGNEVCTLRFRDGRARTVCARELASGRTVEQICRSARRSAFLREVRDGDAGVREADIEDAVAEALERLATTLTVRNAHAHLGDLPQDVDVISVEPIERRPARPRRYVTL